MMLDVTQVPHDLGYYFAGFADGEGSFNVSFRPREDYGEIPWKISLCFNVSQRDAVILSLFKRYLKCGTMRQRKDGVWYYEVRNYKSLQERIIPFFEKFRFFSATKKRNFSIFKKIITLMNERAHCSPEGLRMILELREK